MELVALRNISDKPQPIFYKNKQIVIAPYGEEYFEPELAQYFLEMRAPFVELAEEQMDTVYDASTTPLTMWVANMTGNPDAPKTIRVATKIDRRSGLRMEEDIDNPKHHQRKLVYVMAGDEVCYVDEMGKGQSRREGPKTFVIPPYRRVELQRSIAKWIVDRDRMSMPESHGTCIYSRKPTDFEPDSRWPLNEMRAYLTLCDYRTTPEQLGPTEEDLVKKHKKGTKEFDVALKSAKQALWRRCFFKVCDPSVVLPTRQQFEAVYHGIDEVVEDAMTPTAALSLIDQANKNLNPTAAAKAVLERKS